MRISSTVDIFKLGVGNYKVQKTEVKNLRNAFEHNLHIFSEINSLFVEHCRMLVLLNRPLKQGRKYITQTNRH